MNAQHEFIIEQALKGLERIIERNAHSWEAGAAVAALEAIRGLQKNAAQEHAPAITLELVHNEQTNGLHIRRWENVGGLEAGVHTLYTRPLVQAFKPAQSADQAIEFEQAAHGSQE